MADGNRKDGADIRRTMELFSQQLAGVQSQQPSRNHSRHNSRDPGRLASGTATPRLHSRHASLTQDVSDAWITPPQGAPPASNPPASSPAEHIRGRHGGSQNSQVHFAPPSRRGSRDPLHSDAVTSAPPRGHLPTLYSYKIEQGEFPGTNPAAERPPPATLYSSESEEIKEKAVPFINVESLNDKTFTHYQRDLDEFEAILSIGGMTCAVCTGAVTRGVEELPFIKEVNVNLLTNSASVIFIGPRENIDAIVEKIDDLGYDCSVEDCKLTKSSKRKSKVRRVSHMGPITYDAVLSIGGMTCAVCTGAVTRGLQELSFIKSVNVNLLTNSAAVSFEGPKERIDQIVEKVDDLGYDCSLENCKPTKGQSAVSGEKIVRTGPSTFRATLSIGGMTCAVCTGAVTRGLEELPFVSAIDINLLTNSGVVEFEGKDNLVAIVEKVDDLGYDCSVEYCKELTDEDDDDEDLERTTMVKVDGMMSDVNAATIVQVLMTTYSENLSVDKVLTFKDPIMKITYRPQAPYLTIRHILSTIVEQSSSYTVSIYHPPSLEEKSKLMHIKEQRRILLRLMMCVIIAIPTFLIGILWMSIVGPDNHIRQYMEERMWIGQVSRTEWALLFLSTPIFFFAADIFHKRAIKEVRALWKRGSQVPILRRFYRFGSMNLLMSTGTSIAYFSSIAMLIMGATTKHQKMDGMGMGHTTTYFDSVVFLTMFILIGRYLEAYSKAKTGDAVTMLGKLRPTEATLVVPIAEPDLHEKLPIDARIGSDTIKVNVDMLEKGDIVRVVHGASPPADGKIVEGETRFDESSLTGESRPVSKTVGDEVFAGTVNQGKAISIQVTGVAGDSMLDQIVKVVREGQTKRAPVERIADMITGYFVPMITLIAIVTWIVWLSLGSSGVLPLSWRDVDQGGWAVWSLEFAIAVFVVACPCGIGLAAPTALFVGSGLAAQHGILVKGGGEAFQEASALDVIVFDKTGTLTEGGSPRVSNYDILVSGSQNRKVVWAIAQAMEESSGHPIAKAIVHLCEKQERAIMYKADVEEVAGRGLQGTFAFQAEAGEIHYEAVIGNEEFMELIGAHVDRSFRVNVEHWKTEGKSVALLAIKRVKSPLQEGFADEGFVLTAQFATWDPLRPEATQVVQKLKENGISVWMISGDNVTTATAVAGMVGIPPENVIAGVLPDQKAEKVQWLQRTAPKRGMTAAQHMAALQASATHAQNPSKSPHRAIVAMVGDGINDSPALTMSDVGIAIGSGSDVAISSAKFVLVSSELTSLLTLTDLSRAVFRRVKFNFGWALVYNLCALPIAAGVLYPLKGHIRLNPIFASLAMACSSVSVICSSLLLRSSLPYIGFRVTKIVLPDRPQGPVFTEADMQEKPREKEMGSVRPDMARTQTTRTTMTGYITAPQTPAGDIESRLG